MKVFVYDIAAEDGGGLFVLKNFIKDAASVEGDVEWVFVISRQLCSDAENIKIKTYPWVKKSWIHRYWFETFCLPDILKNEAPDLVISLQNTALGFFRGTQYVYLHQSLQYCPKSFSFFKREEFGLAVRQHIVCNVYKRSLKKASEVFVQTEWIKNATVKWLPVSDDKVNIVPVRVDISKVTGDSYIGGTRKSFFYPARAEIYKNHDVIVEACKLLRQRGICDYNVVFTFSKDDGAYARRIVRESQGLNISFVGLLEFDQVARHYKNSALLFPSYLETCGVPMLEAKAVGCPVFASDMPFSNEALNGYSKACFFEYDDPKMLADLMQSYIETPESVVIPEQCDENKCSCDAKECATLPEAMLKRFWETKTK